MEITVRKRDGRIVPFCDQLIARAIKLAMISCDCLNEMLAERLANEIAGQMEDKSEWTVNEIQTIVENKLMASNMPDVARSYIIYRDKRDKARNSTSDTIIKDIIAAKKNDITRENANMNADTPAGMMMKIASERSKEFVDNFLLSEEACKLVADNILHIHDKDYYPTRSLTCIQHPVGSVLANGFMAGHGESRPAKRIETASILSAISMETVQNEMHGGQAIPAFDFYLAPYVRKTYQEEIEKLEALFGNLSHLYDIEIEDYLVREVKANERLTEDGIKQVAINNTVNRVHQAMEAFIHNMNTIHSRGGNQVVFSSINYGTDTSAEGRCIMRELLLSTERGVGNGSTAIFPIQIWKKKRGVNYYPSDPNYDLYQLACRVTAKRFFPNFVNLDATFNQNDKWDQKDPERYKHEVATMGCVDGKELIHYAIGSQMFLSTFEEMWDRLSQIFRVHKQEEELGVATQEDAIPVEEENEQTQGNANEGESQEQEDQETEEQEPTVEPVEPEVPAIEPEYMDLCGVKILDNTEYVECLRIIRNPDKGDWMRVRLTDGRSLLCTADHPWSIDGRTVLARDLQVGFNVAVGNGRTIAQVFEIEVIGECNKPSYDVTTATEHFTVSGIRSHNCRTRVFENRHGEKTSIARGNLSFSTINLPGLALRVRDIKNKEDRLAEFFNLLTDAIHVTARQLHDRYEFQCTALAKQFPLLMSGMWVGSDQLKAEDEVRPVLKHGTLGIGFIGLAECLIALVGKHHAESEEAQTLGLQIIGYMRDMAREYSDFYDLNYSVLATPAEGLSGKFTKKDKKMFGVIPGITDKDYYTNSNHVPVYYHCSAAFKAQIEAPYHDLTRGGHIFYVELDGDATHNIEAVTQVVDLMDKYDIGYCSINHNRNRCMDCGYEDASKNLTECPCCGSRNIDKLQRITGYLVGTTDRWNSGKLAELKDRVTHG